jgi:hypothetical protein
MSIIHWPLNEWLSNVALAALSRKETLLATYDLAQSVIKRGIPGDFVECGVFGGAQCAVMARAIMKADCGGRRVHLFDSFEGVPAAGPNDVDFACGGHAAGVSKCSLEGVKQHMEEWGIPDELLVYHPGWFADTVPWENQHASSPSYPEQIALLRLDGDLYESTRVCMDHLYPLLSPGGWLIVDDYGLDGARKAVAEYFSGNYPPAYFQRMPE